MRINFQACYHSGDNTEVLTTAGRKDNSVAMTSQVVDAFVFHPERKKDRYYYQAEILTIIINIIIKKYILTIIIIITIQV